MKKQIMLIIKSRKDFNFDDIGIDITDEGEIIIFPKTENFDVVACAITQLTKINNK